MRPGKITTFEGFESIEHLPYVYSAQKRRAVGGLVENTGDVRQRAAEFCAYIEDRKNIPSFFEKVYNTVRILDEKGDDMIISKVEHIK